MRNGWDAMASLPGSQPTPATRLDIAERIAYASRSAYFIGYYGAVKTANQM
jgi:hypothetical protein